MTPDIYIPPGLPPYYYAALKEVSAGVREVPGPKDNARIMEYLATVERPGALRRRFVHDETPWCSAFVNWCVTTEGFTGTGSPAARSWLRWGQHCSLRLGAILVLTRGINPLQGHVGFVVAFDDRSVTLAGGNQLNRASIRKYPRERAIDCRA